MGTTAVSIRRVKEQDQDQIISLIKRIMSEEFTDDQSAYPTQDIEDISKGYGGIGDAFFVAEDKDRIIGTVAVKKEDDREALLRRIFVDGDYRKQKIGVKLVDRALQFCKEVGYDQITFRATSRMSGAVHLCQKKGFTQKAKLDLGSVELLKFSLSLRDGR